MAELAPTNGYMVYDLSSQLFADYASKQRLIKIPDGSRLQVRGNGLPGFPDSSILVKTFYYPVNPSALQTKRIIETRILLLKDGRWNVGTYKWNDDQTDAFLTSSGVNEKISFIDPSNRPREISYHIPNERECATCHNSNENILPLGPKIRNLNIQVFRDGRYLNQLSYFQNVGVLDAMNPGNFSNMPDYANPACS